jgi:glycosyltransferase involved in cell wall biosynthesis
LSSATGIERMGTHNLTITPSVPSLRVAITVDPEIPVPPRLYGGIERIVDMLVRGLMLRGHHVTLFAHPDSQVPCELLAYPRLRSQSSTDTLINLWYVSSHVQRRGFDLLHSFARLAYALPLLPRRLPKIMSYQRQISPHSVRLGNLLSRRLHFTGCSAQLIHRWISSDNFHVVYNGVPTELYRGVLRVAQDAPLIYLGRIEAIKGVHLTVEVARRSKRRLVIAGNVPEAEHHQKYFRERILPYVDDVKIRYVGPVDNATKNELLGQSAALLLPLLWEEPFGIVMAEALACGTPVIGLRRGALPEIVEHGVNGFVCDSVEDMVAGVGQLDQISRAECRRTSEERFSDRVIVQHYENLYRTVIQEHRN